MKILLVSAGTKPNGSTERAMEEARRELVAKGAVAETYCLYPTAIATCSGCGGCKKDGRCVHDDAATRLLEIAPDFDGYIFFSPVHYAGAAGSLKSAMSRLFISKKSALEYKPAAAVTVARRGGNVTALEEITRFFTFASMPSVSGNYPGIIHGACSDDVEKDEEGLQTIRSIADNMVWLISCIEAGKKAGIEHPTPEAKIKTSYIR